MSAFFVAEFYQWGVGKWLPFATWLVKYWTFDIFRLRFIASKFQFRRRYFYRVFWGNFTMGAFMTYWLRCLTRVAQYFSVNWFKLTWVNCCAFSQWLLFLDKFRNFIYSGRILWNIQHCRRLYLSHKVWTMIFLPLLRYFPSQIPPYFIIKCQNLFHVSVKLQKTFIITT